jgi:hypothetical protein
MKIWNELHAGQATARLSALLPATQPAAHGTVHPNPDFRLWAEEKDGSKGSWRTAIDSGARRAVSGWVVIG